MAKLRIIPNKRREIQVQETRRKLFDAKAKRAFLDHFAATCNASAAARAAGFDYRTAFRHRNEDPEFGRKWEEALRTGYARLEELAVSQAIAALDWEPPTFLEAPQDGAALKLDATMALQLLREHKRGLAGVRKPGRMPAAATNAEIIEALTKRLSAFGVHVGGARKRT